MGLFDSGFDPWPSVGASSDTWSPSTGGSWSDVFTPVSQAASAITGIASTVSNAVLGWQTAQANIKNQQQQLELQKIVSNAGVDVAKAQAANAVKEAQNPGLFSSLGADNIATALSNLNTRLSSGSGSGTEKIMLYMTFAGLGLAAMQYFKKRG